MIRSIPFTRSSPARALVSVSGLRLVFLSCFGLLCAAFAQPSPPLRALPSAAPAADSSRISGSQAFAPPAEDDRPGTPLDWGQVGKASLWSLGATLVPILAGTGLANASDALVIPGALLIAGGLAVGPSAGQWSLGAYPQGALGTLIRLPGMVLVAAGFVQALGNAFCGMNSDGEEGRNSCSEDDGSGLAETGALLYLAGTAYSLVDLPFAVQRKWRRDARYGLAPVLRPGLQGGASRGLVAWVRF